jgi:translation initiation factor IF-3
MLGVVETREGLRLAQSKGMDLVEISPNADPPVCRIMDYGKFRYQESVKRKEAKKNQHARAVKEVKFHANVGEHDYQTKVGHARDFLSKGHKVKLTLTFRGRENAHRELGFEVMERVVRDLSDEGVIDMAPRLMGRAIIGMMGPRTAKSTSKARPAPKAPDGDA